MKNETAEQFIARKLTEKNVTATLQSPEEGKTWTFQVEAQTFISDYPKMVYLIERLSGGWISGETKMYRIGFYRLMENGTWHRPLQNPIISKKMLELLYAKAIVDGTLV